MRLLALLSGLRGIPPDLQDLRAETARPKLAENTRTQFLALPAQLFVHLKWCGEISARPGIPKAREGRLRAGCATA